MSEMKLIYFNGRGRAELIRLLFTQGGKTFIDQRVGQEEWAKLKPSTPKGQLPVLEHNGKMMCESLAIARYVARELGLYGKDNWESGICDMLMDGLLDLLLIVVERKYKAKTEEEKAACEEKLIKELEALDKLAAKYKQGEFVLGEQVSVADVSIYNAYDFVLFVLPDFKFADYSTLDGIVKAFASQPHIADYLKARPEPEF